MIDFITGIFKDSNGLPSSKRIIAFWLMVLLTIYLFNHPDFNNIAAILTAITAILGVQAVTHS